MPAPPAWALVAYGAMSAVTWAAFALDKHRAVKGGRRVPERTLHGLELLGGWPGALLAMRHLRHKTQKPRYRAVLAAVVAVHLVAWALWAGASG